MEPALPGLQPQDPRPRAGIGSSRRPRRPEGLLRLRDLLPGLPQGQAGAQGRCVRQGGGHEEGVRRVPAPDVATIGLNVPSSAWRWRQKELLCHGTAANRSQRLASICGCYHHRVG